MLATLVDKPFDDKMWVFETKWDGFRLVTEKHGDTATLWSRNGIDVTTKYAVLPSALQKIEGSCVIDGELAHTASGAPAEVVKLTVPPRAAAACFARRRFSPLARLP
jgi:ATP-dependent DNA ligase